MAWYTLDVRDNKVPNPGNNSTTITITYTAPTSQYQEYRQKYSRQCTVSIFLTYAKAHGEKPCSGYSSEAPTLPTRHLPLPV
jgi:hypothetical protein